MRLIGYGQDGVRYAGIVAKSGAITPSGRLDEFFADPFLASTAQVDADDGPLRVDDLTQVPFVPSGAKIFCVGRNYAEHLAEANNAVTEHPVIFTRFTSTLVCSGDSVPVPACEEGLDWEVELAVIVGRQLYNATESEAADAVFGYTVFNDLSARARQFHTSQFALGKNADRSAPMGPVVVTRDELDVSDVKLQTIVNGRVMQSGSTSQLIFSIPRVLSYISEVSTLNPGDVVATGTPSGVGWFRQPRVLLKPGDEVEVSVDGIGVLRTPLVAPRT